MQEIPIHQIDNFVLLLKRAHQKGFAFAESHIMEPLRLYFGHRDEHPHADLVKNLELQKKVGEWRIAANIYRHIFHVLSFDADHHPLFNMLNTFLLDLQSTPALRRTTFAFEFFKIFEFSIKNMQETVSNEVLNGLDKIFDNHDDAHVVVSHDLTTNQRENLNREAAALYQNIELAYARGDEARLSYLLAQFTGRFCNFPEVRFRDEVDRIILKVSENNAAFKQEVRSRLAVRLFQSIARASENADIKTAIRGIATYIVTFQDDLNLPYREELDRIEERMYKFIDQHNLWHRVRIQHATNKPPLARPT